MIMIPGVSVKAWQLAREIKEERKGGRKMEGKSGHA